MRILPWEKVTNGPTGAPPDGMPGFINVLVQLGQLFYKGLVAIGTFLVNLGEAIWDWGMRALGAVSQAVAGAVQTVADALGSFIKWAWEWLQQAFDSLVRPLIDGILSAKDGWVLTVQGNIARTESASTSGNFWQGAAGYAERLYNTMFTDPFTILLWGAVTAIVAFLTAARIVSLVIPGGALFGKVADWFLAAFVEVLVTSLGIFAIELGALAILYLLYPEGDSFWKTTTGSVAVPLAVSLFNLVMLAIEGTAAYRIPIVLEAFGLVTMTIGFLLSFSLTGVLGKLIAVFAAGTGLAIILKTPETPLLPFPYIEELLGTAGLLTAAYNLGVELL